MQIEAIATTHSRSWVEIRSYKASTRHERVTIDFARITLVDIGCRLAKNGDARIRIDADNDRYIGDRYIGDNDRWSAVLKAIPIITGVCPAARRDPCRSRSRRHCPCDIQVAISASDPTQPNDRTCNRHQSDCDVLTATTMPRPFR